MNIIKVDYRMARTTIDETAWEAVHEIKDQLGWRKHEIIGVLTVLWHKTQKLEITSVSRRDFIKFTGLRGVDDSELTLLLEALVTEGFLSSLEGGDLYIHGNAHHIAKLQKWRENGRKGGKKKKSGEKMPPSETPLEPTLNQEVSDAESGGEPSSNQTLKQAVANSKEGGNPELNQYNTIQSNTNQSNSTQPNTIHPTAPPGECVKPLDLIEIWNALAPPGKIYKSFSYARTHLDELMETLNHRGFQTREEWEEIFSLAFKSDFLKSKSWFLLTWVIVHKNASDILHGKYPESVSECDEESGEFTVEDIEEVP